MKQKEKVAAIIAALKAQYPEPVCALQYKKDYELMIAVRLVGPVYRRESQPDHPGALCRATRHWRRWRGRRLRRWSS